MKLIWMPTRSGGAVDLVDPRPETIDVETDIAVALSMINRFAGHAGNEARGYSVAQHSVRGADAVLAETGDTMAALHFLLHDGHEAYIGDIVTPVVAALGAIAVELLHGGFIEAERQEIARLPKAALSELKLRLDQAIYARLRLMWPLSPTHRAIVADMDLRMLRMERDLLLPATPLRWVPEVEAARSILALDWSDFEPMEPMQAASEWLARLADWMPHPIPEIPA